MYVQTRKGKAAAKLGIAMIYVVSTPQAVAKFISEKTSKDGIYYGK